VGELLTGLKIQRRTPTILEYIHAYPPLGDVGMIDLSHEIANRRSNRIVVRAVYADEEDSSFVWRAWLFDLSLLLGIPRVFFPYF
jgi:hypothetical protein